VLDDAGPAHGAGFPRCAAGGTGSWSGPGSDPAGRRGVSGVTAEDESSVTGEAMPVTRGVAGEVFARDLELQGVDRAFGHPGGARDTTLGLVARW
jgi:hypothetical protein